MLAWKGEISWGYPNSTIKRNPDGTYSGNLGQPVMHRHWGLVYHTNLPGGHDALAVLPLRPLFPGAIVNGLLYGTLLMIVWHALKHVLGSARRAWRGLRHRCKHCGYDAGDLSVCPECGEDVGSSERFTRA